MEDTATHSGENLMIPSISIGKTDGNKLFELLKYHQNVTIMIKYNYVKKKKILNLHLVLECNLKRKKEMLIMIEKL